MKVDGTVEILQLVRSGRLTTCLLYPIPSSRPSLETFSKFLNSSLTTGYVPSDYKMDQYRTGPAAATVLFTGSTESAQQREDSRKCDDEEAKADEESANNLQDGGTPDVKLLQKNGQISGLSEKAAGKTEEVNGLCEDRVVADVGETNSVIISQNKDIPETIETLTEKIPPLENVMGRNHQMQTMRHQQMRLKQK
ncbi:uncharacterized protein ACWYII_016322 [Salvelinus alpinus]